MRCIMSMRQSVWVVSVALLLGLSLAAPAFAAEGKAGGTAVEPARPAAPADKPAEKSGAAKEAKGKVISVNAGTKTLVVDADGKRMVFSVAEPAAKDLAKIKSGEQVTVRYTEDGGKFMAQEVTKG